MSNPSPELPPIVPSPAELAAWHDLYDDAMQVASLALAHKIKPTVTLQAVNGEPISVGWGIINHEYGEVDHKKRELREGVMIHQSGRLALYKGVMVPKTDLVVIEYSYKLTPYIDKPPVGSVLWLSKDTYPHETSQAHRTNFYQATMTPGNVRGLAAIDRGLREFEATIT